MPLFGGKRDPQLASQTVNEPWDEAQPYIKDIFSRAQGQYDAMAGEMTDPNFAAASALLGDTIQGDYLGQGNPYLDDLYSRGADDLTNRMKTIAEANGRYGSGWFGDTLGTGLGNLYSQVYAPAYESERNRQMQAAGMVPSLSFSQQQAPWQNLGNYANIVGGVGGGGTSSVYEPTTGPLLGALSGALSGFGATGGPLGAIGGGLLGFFS